MSNKHSYRFTVFTATFNRRNLLGGVYESLRRQTFKDFEWIIVDDGSTDDTEGLISAWIAEDVVPIRYVKQKNRGKHAAINIGVQMALGDFFLIVDSDDSCVDDALEKLIHYWDLIPAEQKSVFSGVMSNCANKQGILIGSNFPEDIFDASFIDTFYKIGIKGDKWGFFKTEVLRQFPFPIIENETFLTEALVWNRIALKFKTRFINESLLIVNYQRDGLSCSSLKLRTQFPKGATLYYKEFLYLPTGYFWKFRNLINYLRFSLHSKQNIIAQIHALDSNIFGLVSVIALPFACLIYMIDLIKVKV